MLHTKVRVDNPHVNVRPTPQLVQYNVRKSCTARTRPSIVKASMGSPVHPLVEEVLLPANDIKSRVEKVGKQLAAEYAMKRPIIVVTLKGATVFASDLVRAMDPVPDGLELDFVRASSYGAATHSSGNVVLSLSTLSAVDIEGRHILLVEDIVDTGRTADALMAHYRDQGAASVRLVALLSKPARREIELEPDYLCFTIPDKFVVGYGLDFAEHLRSLPYIGVLRPEAYAE